MNSAHHNFLRALGYSVLVSLLMACDSGDQSNVQADNSGPVRAAQLKTSGSIAGEFSPVDAGTAKLLADCGSGGFAIFTILFSPFDEWRQVGVSVQTVDAISVGQTGPVEIDWALLTFSDSNYDATEFRGPAELVISLHDNSTPQMSGKLQGKIPGYGGIMATEKVEADRSIDFEFTFDLNMACGTNQ